MKIPAYCFSKIVRNNKGRGPSSNKECRAHLFPLGERHYYDIFLSCDWSDK